MRSLLFVLFGAIALPVQAQTVAGSTPGSFRVTESGAGEYRIPIRVPSGIAGMEPKLALTYNSQGGNGLLGMGWSLEGLSVVTRCPRTLAQDGVRGRVDYTLNDRFCLDGQRLILVSGTYGGHQAEYRTERESFTKVVSYGVSGNGPAWFQAWTKSGQLMIYGATTDSLIEAQGTGTARVWALNKVFDTKYNYLTVTYTEDQPNGEYYPVRLDYTGNGAQSPSHSVQFAYQGRSDSASQYHAGSMVRTAMRLTNVRTYAGTTLVKNYQLTYDPNGGALGRSRLTQVQECDGAGACLPALTFAWQASGNGSFSYMSTVTPYYEWYGVTPLDVDGDGRSDYLINTTNGGWQVWTSNGGSGTFTYRGQFSPYSAWHSPTIGDFNGDGRSDVMINTTNGGWQVWFSNGDGTFTYKGTPTPYSEWHSPAIGDFDGDGRSDYLINTTNGGWQVWTSNGDGTFAYRGVFSPYSPWHSPRIGDFNGDGLSDVLINTTNGGWQVWFSNGDGTFTYKGTPTPYSAWHSVAIGDFNGDGKSDYLVNNTETWEVWFSRGDGTFALGGTVSPYAAWHSPAVGDFDGDGKSDFLINTTSTWDAWLSRGDGTFAWAGSVTPYSAWHSPTVADYNGDGKSDFLINTVTPGGGWRLYAANPYLYPLPDVLLSITNGTAIPTSVTYKPLTDASVYTKETTAAYPVVDLQMPLWVVSSSMTDNGIGGTAQTNVSYTGAKSDHTGRGYLGFREILYTDAQTGLRSQSTFRQDWPYVGLPSLVKKTQSSGATLKQTVNTYSCTNPGNGGACTVAAGNRYFPFVSQSVETGNDLNGTALPTVTTTTQYADGFGNPTTITVSTGDGHSKTTTNTFLNNVTSWLLGRLTRSTVQSASP